MNIDSPYIRLTLIPKAMYSLINARSLNYGTGETTEEVFESLNVPSGYTKPSFEVFESKLLELVNNQPLQELRTERDTLLNQTDKYGVSDYPHTTPEKKQEWLDYRQALRDLPANTADPSNPVWPTLPTA
jgi:hypothetical protein